MCEWERIQQIRLPNFWLSMSGKLLMKIVTQHISFKIGIWNASELVSKNEMSLIQLKFRHFTRNIKKEKKFSRES